MNYSCKNVCGTGPAFTCENDFEEKGNFSSSNFLRFDNFFFLFQKFLQEKSILTFQTVEWDSLLGGYLEAGNTKGGSITVPLTSSLTGLD